MQIKIAFESKECDLWLACVFFIPKICSFKIKNELETGASNGLLCTSGYLIFLIDTGTWEKRGKKKEIKKQRRMGVKCRKWRKRKKKWERKSKQRMKKNVKKKKNGPREAKIMWLIGSGVFVYDVISANDVVNQVIHWFPFRHRQVVRKQCLIHCQSKKTFLAIHFVSYNPGHFQLYWLHSNLQIVLKHYPIICLCRENSRQRYFLQYILSVAPGESRF